MSIHIYYYIYFTLYHYKNFKLFVEQKINNRTIVVARLWLDFARFNTVNTTLKFNRFSFSETENTNVMAKKKMKVYFPGKHQLFLFFSLFY